MDSAEKTILNALVGAAFLMFLGTYFSYFLALGAFLIGLFILYAVVKLSAKAIKTALAPYIEFVKDLQTALQSLLKI